MYEHRGNYIHANTVLTHGKGKDHHCMVVCFGPLIDNLLAYVVLRVQVRLGCFLVVQRK